MKIESLRKEIQELRNSLICRCEPAYKVFIAKKDESHTEAEVDAYRESHPHTHVILLFRRSCRSGVSE